MTMWLPTPVYERIPQFWFLLGLLFISNGLYIGLDISFAMASIFVGIGCCVSGVGIAIIRLRFRQRKSSSSFSGDETSASQGSIY
jgi:hypothetical protein